MISPGERFDAFSSNRLNKKDSGVGYQLSSTYTIGPKTHALFVFFHLLNRSVTNTPWIFYISLFFITIQILTGMFEPYNFGIWQGKYPQLQTFLKVCSIIVRYVPSDATSLTHYIIFAIIAIFTFAHFILLIIIISKLRAQNIPNWQMKVFFYYSFLILPIFQTCFITTTGKHLRAIVEKPSVLNFFVSLIALLVLITFIFMQVLAAIATGTSPSPNLNNPLSIWAPNTDDSVLFYILFIFEFLIVELESNAKGLTLSILLIVRCSLALILSGFHIGKIYYISFGAYQFVTSLFMSWNIYMIVLIVLSFYAGIIPYWTCIFIWILLPFILFICLKIYTHIRIVHVLMKLKGTNKVENVSRQVSSSDEEELLGVYGDMKLGNSENALFAVRAACILGLDTFIDGSLVKYVIHTYENLSFQMLYMSFLIPDNLNLLKQMIDSYLSRKNPKFLEAAILFQLLTSIQESSNELCSSISHEISKQSLAGFKCEQILTKFWAGCYKGDITQMSRTTFMLYQNLAELSYSWKQLILRYPYSLPTMKEYIKFLNGVGRQHKIAEALLKMHPKLNEPITANNQTMQSGGVDSNSDINIALLHQSIEDAVDRRPLSSLSQTKARLWFTIILSFIFILSSIILAFVSMHMTSSMSNFLYFSDTTCSLIFHSPNLFEEIITNGDKGRQMFFNHSQILDDAITNLLKEMPDKILKNNSNLTHQLWNKVEEYSGLENTGIVKFLRLYSYYARSVPFVPVDDNLVLLMKNNTLGIGYSVFLASDAELVSIQQIISKLVKYIPIFYGVIWGVMLIIMVPLIVSALQNVKNELKYIFNLYITIPRSFITELMDPSSKNKITDNKKNMFLQQALASNISPFDEDEKEPVKVQKEVKGVDNLKLLVHDQSTTGTVIPKYFQLKVWLIVGSITAILLAAATLEVYLFSNFVNEMMIMFKTLQMTARRTTGCSIVLQGILSNFTYLPYSYCSYRLQLTKDFNSKLLLATSTKEVSKSMLTSSAFYSLVHDKSCSNQTDRGCWPFTYMFDYFMILASKAYNSSISREEVNDLVMLYNDYLYPRSYQLHEAGFEYINSQLTNERTVLLVIFFVVIIVVSLSSFVFFLPIMKQLDATIESVKLPLKYIPPMRVPDLPKVMQYLQGEADWHRGGIMNETDTRLGNYLNIIEYPHALFEQDKSLLFANPNFYNLIGAPREACIGLSLDTIFSRLINYKNDDKHPFNHVLRYFDEDGSTDQSCLKLITQFERGSHKAKNVEIRMSKIMTENDKYIYAMIFEDLSYHDHKEEMMRYERQVAENLKMYALPQQLSNVLTTDGELKSKTFDRAVMASFSLSYATIRDEYDGELADGCLLFMKAAKEVSGVFPNMVKLIHEPPHFVFMQIPDDLEPIDVQTVQGVHFINAIYNSFNSSSNKFKLSTMMLVGPIIVIPMKVKLPVLEAFGDGYKALITKRDKIKNSGKFYVTKETAVYLSDNKSFTLTADKDLELVSITPKHIEE